MYSWTSSYWRPCDKWNTRNKIHNLKPNKRSVKEGRNAQKEAANVRSWLPANRRLQSKHSLRCIGKSRPYINNLWHWNVYTIFLIHLSVSFIILVQKAETATGSRQNHTSDVKLGTCVFVLFIYFLAGTDRMLAEIETSSREQDKFGKWCKTHLSRFCKFNLHSHYTALVAFKTGVDQSISCQIFLCGAVWRQRAQCMLFPGFSRWFKKKKWRILTSSALALRAWAEDTPEFN